MTQTCFQKPLAEYRGKALEPLRIGILGGTFDPVHNGHIQMGKAAYEEFGLSCVLMIPCGLPPHKDTGKVTPAEHRLRMLEIACGGIPYFEVKDLEIIRKGYTYSVDTLRQLRQCYPEGTEFYYIVGSDTLCDLVNWRDYRTVFRLTRFLVIPRQGMDQQPVEEEMERLQREFGARIEVCDRPCLEVSSTQIRSLARKGRSMGALLPEGVEAYIRRHHVYGVEA